MPSTWPDSDQSWLENEVFSDANGCTLPFVSGTPHSRSGYCSQGRATIQAGHIFVLFSQALDIDTVEVYVGCLLREDRKPLVCLIRRNKRLKCMMYMCVNGEGYRCVGLQSVYDVLRLQKGALEMRCP
jgi:hypothetical protein